MVFIGLLFLPPRNQLQTLFFLKFPVNAWRGVQVKVGDGRPGLSAHTLVPTPRGLTAFNQMKLMKQILMKTFTACLRWYGTRHYKLWGAKWSNDSQMLTVWDWWLVMSENGDVWDLLSTYLIFTPFSVYIFSSIIL